MGIDYKRNTRKLAAFILVIASYYVIHEGAHLIMALIFGSFKQINFLQLGVQIEIYRERMSGLQLGVFCMAGPAVTIVLSYVLLFMTKRIVQNKSLFYRAFAYYMTLLFLLNDPFYLSVLYPYVGGGDMNGIKLLIPEIAARSAFAMILLVNLYVVIKYLFPVYRKAYHDSENGDKREDGEG